MSNAYPGVITTDYNNTKMGNLNDADYETLHTTLVEQLAACLDYGDQSAGAASDALANTWQPDLTALEWLSAAGSRLGCDTSECEGV